MFVFDNTKTKKPKKKVDKSKLRNFGRSNEEIPTCILIHEDWTSVTDSREKMNIFVDDAKQYEVTSHDAIA